MLQGCCFFVHLLAGPMCSHPTTQFVIIIAASILPSQFICREVKWGKELQFAISLILDLKKNVFSFFSCILMFVSLQIDETYRVEISPKTQVACTCRLFTVISGILIWNLCHQKALHFFLHQECFLCVKCQNFKKYAAPKIFPCQKETCKLSKCNQS